MQPGPGGTLHLEHGVTISFDTYFGALFEQQWRVYTLAGRFTLTLDLAGRALIRIWRRTAQGSRSLLHERLMDGPGAIGLPDDKPHFRQTGRIWFELTAQDGPVTLRTAEWSASAPTTVAPARLGVVICTFNREADLRTVLATLAEDSDDDAVARIVVVNQGRPGLRTSPAIAPAAVLLADRLRIVEQANLGGAGGFGRGLLETLDDPAVTHVCFLDDDVRIEPESLRRMAAFFTLAKHGFALGGHMLDSVRPTTLYEGGATVEANGGLTPLHHALDLTRPAALDSLMDIAAMHYNGWWMFGFPKSLAASHGMPLPCFIRGDDVEFGLRLHEAGVPTVPLPGVGIWHEPFYLKIGGWQLYYETRNALIAAALHQDFSPNRIALMLAKRLLTQLLTYRYYSAALIVRAIEDFRTGPAILDQDPRPLHASLAPLQARYPPMTTPRERVLPPAPVGGSPRHRIGFGIAMLQALWRNTIRPTAPSAPPAWLDVKDLVWFRVQGADSLAVDTHWDLALPTYRRDRAAFRSLLPAGLRAINALRARAPSLVAQWREEAPRLTSVPFWRGYVRYGATPDDPHPPSPALRH